MVNNNPHDLTSLVALLQSSNLTPKQVLKPLGLTTRSAEVIEGAASRSKDAERKYNQRQKEKLLGLKPISLPIPIEIHPQLKELSRLTKRGTPADAAIKEAFKDVLGDSEFKLPNLPHLASPDINALLIEMLHSLSPWRRWAIQSLLRWKPAVPVNHVQQQPDSLSGA